MANYYHAPAVPPQQQEEASFITEQKASVGNSDRCETSEHSTSLEFCNHKIKALKY